VSDVYDEPEANDDSAAGFGMVPRFLRGRLSAHQIAVYVALSWRVGRNGECWLSLARLAAEAGTSKKTVQRALDAMRDEGIVSWVPMYRPDGSVQCNRYTLHIFGSGRRRPTRNVTPSGQRDHPPWSQGPTPVVGMTTRTRVHEEDSLNVPHSGPGDAPGDADAADPLDAIEDAVNGYEAGEESLAFSMLEKDCHPKAIVNAIESQRSRNNAFRESIWGDRS
jgi:hypothetical protein